MSGWYILGDWGSTRLRLWRVQGGAIVDRLSGPGIVGLPDAPADALRAAMTPWLADGPPGRIVLGGMAGARGGLREAPYAECPLAVADWRRTAVAFDLDGVPVRIAAGCADGARDVMRGEETQLFGALALRPELGRGRQVAVLPGTHCKWVEFDDGVIVSFRTFLTGELFALLQQSSLLAAASAGAGQDEGDGFAAGVAQARRGPGVTSGLFAARAAQLREGRSPAWARAYLSGLLIAGEAAEMQAAAPLPPRVTLIGDAGLGARYTAALAAFDVETDALDGEESALAGLGLFDEEG